jgi:NADH-quinone oxidoreductase subunit J
MSIDLVLFIVLAVVAIGAAIGMLLSQNAVYAALYLIVNFGAVAVFYLLLQAPFISLAQVTVYAGAIMVLFLFVIMLLGAERMKVQPTLRWQLPLAIVLGVVLLIEAGYVLATRLRDLPVLGAEPAVDGFGVPERIGEVLFSQYLLPFEITSVLLLVAMIGAIVLTKRRA